MADLMSYLPPYYEDITEFIELTNTENPEIDLLWENIALVKDNQFVMLSDESKIRQWEKILNIRPDYTTQSLSYRKKVVIIRLSTRPPLTHRWLEEKTASIVGKGKFVINIYYDMYELRIRLTNDTLSLINEYRTYFRRIIPANLGLILEELFGNWGEVRKHYTTWGCTPIFHNWDTKLTEEWASILGGLNWSKVQKHNWLHRQVEYWNQGFKDWYVFSDKAKKGGVISSECWWTRHTLSWHQANYDLSWYQFFQPNTWQDVKNYIWEDGTE